MMYFLLMRRLRQCKTPGTDTTKSAHSALDNGTENERLLAVFPAQFFSLYYYSKGIRFCKGKMIAKIKNSGKLLVKRSLSTVLTIKM